jgi:hemoglobin-like flavoprotein
LQAGLVGVIIHTIIGLNRILLFPAGTRKSEVNVQILESLDEILSERKLVTEQFYNEKLFNVYPEFIAYFSAADMKVQAVMLMMALQGVVCYVGGSYPAVGYYLRYLGTRHRKLGIPEELFPKFCDMLLTTVAEFHGPAWDEELAGQWRAALAGASKIMLEGYKQDSAAPRTIFGDAAASE